MYSGFTDRSRNIVPEFTGDGKDAVMIHHLLTYTSGITPEAVSAHAALKQKRGELESDDPKYPGISRRDDARPGSGHRSLVCGGARRSGRLGYGWNIRLGKRETNRSGLKSPRTFEHGGACGVELLVDPEYELVLVYLSVEASGEMGAIHQWQVDHFTDVALSAIDD